MVVVVGIDVHKGTHTAVAVDEAGRRIGQPRTVRTTSAGHRQLVRWAGQVRVQVVQRSGPGVRVEFAVEDCRHLTVGLERDLLAAGEVVVRVPPKLMAQARSSARTRGKSDPIDALAIARAALREQDLPRAEHTPASRQVKLLVDHREDLVAMRTASQNRLRWHLHTLNQVTAGGDDPALDPPERSLDRPKQLDALAARLEAIDVTGLDVDGRDADLVTTRRIALELVADIRAWTVRVNALEREIAALTAQQVPGLLALDGCGALTAGKILGEVANPGRFRNEAAFAMHAGVAPIPASSGKTSRHRLARGGNRQLNAALHRIAVTQIRLKGSLGHAYYQRRLARGDTTKEALRALKRRLARVVYRLLTTPTATATTPLPRAA
jgi:transposase